MLSKIIAVLLGLVLVGPLYAQGPIRKVTFEFKLPDAQFPYAESRVVKNTVYFRGPITTAKLIAFLKAHPQGASAQQAQGYANKLSFDPPEEAVELYLAKLDAKESLPIVTTGPDYSTKWTGQNGTLWRYFFLWVSNTESAWVEMKIVTMPTGD